LRYLVVNKLLRDIQFTVSTSGTGISDKFTLTGLAAEGYLIRTSPASTLKLS
jgi:hypothetical protein